MQFVYHPVLTTHQPSMRTTVGVSPKIVGCNSSYGCFVLGVTPLVWCQGMRASSWGSGRWCHLRRGGGGLTKTDSTIMGLGVLAKPRMAHAISRDCLIPSLSESPNRSRSPSLSGSLNSSRSQDKIAC